MRPLSRAAWFAMSAWALLLGGYIAVCLWVPAGVIRTSTADVLLCLMPLLVNGSLLVNAVTADWRKRAFWTLLALGSSLWLAGQTIWTYMEVYERRHAPYLFNGYHFNLDIVFYLHAIPMIAALALEPHKSPQENQSRRRYVDFALVLCWWLYLYVFAVIPWQYVVADGRRYRFAFSSIALLQNFVFVAGAGALFMKSQGYWRRIYAHLAAARAVYVIRLVGIQMIVGRGLYSRGSLYDVPLLLSFAWLSLAGISAYQNRDVDAAASPSDTPSDTDPVGVESSSSDDPRWASFVARMALLSLPLIGVWCMKFSQAPMAVHQFRILVTLGAVLPLGALVFLRHEMVDRERLRLLRASQDSLDNLKRLQTQFVQSEK